MLTKCAHAYDVLHAARAPAPPLALAEARASFLRRLTSKGPSMLAQLLFDHWVTHPGSSWLAQLSFDVCADYLPCSPEGQSCPFASGRPG